MLNSNCSAVGGCGFASPQAGWLRTDLAANKGKDVLAYWHHPRFSSGEHGGSPGVQAFWEILYAAGADVILNGHDHDYERFARQDPWGRADTPFGIREFVVGTGGAESRGRASTAANSQIFSSSFGVLRLTLHKGSYDWVFQPIAGSSFRDSGTTVTHGAPPPRTTRSFAISDDTYADQGHPGTNYGGASLLRIDNDAGGGADRQAYVKATVSGISGRVDRAALRFWVADPTTDGPRVYRTTTSWTGGSLTWSNRPAATGSAASDAGAIALGRLGGPRRHGHRAGQRYVRIPDRPDLGERDRSGIAPGRASAAAHRPDGARQLSRVRTVGYPQGAHRRRSGTDPRQSCAPPRRPREEPWTTSPF